MNQCPRCGTSEFWLLGSGRQRCKNCKLTRKKSQTGWESSRISPYWKGKLTECFCFGVPAYRLRFQVPLNYKTVQRWYRILREIIYHDSLQALERLSGKIEMDETMFGGHHPGKRGWGAEGKIMVFGMYKRNGHVIVFPISSRGKKILIPMIETHTKPGSLFYTDDWHAYASLSVTSRHVVVRKERGVPKGRDHINGIEGFWSFAKHWLYQYRGVPKHLFHLYLKEIEWRFNHRHQNLVPLLRKLLRRRIVNVQL